jgi:hypothetical protein
MTKQFTHIADVKVSKIRGNSRIYPQLRLLSHTQNSPVNTLVFTK